MLCALYERTVDYKELKYFYSVLSLLNACTFYLKSSATHPTNSTGDSVFKHTVNTFVSVCTRNNNIPRKYYTMTKIQ